MFDHGEHVVSGALDAAGRNGRLGVVLGVVDITVLHVRNVQARDVAVVAEDSTEDRRQRKGLTTPQLSSYLFVAHAAAFLLQKLTSEAFFTNKNASKSTHAKVTCLLYTSPSPRDS